MITVYTPDAARAARLIPAEETAYVITAPDGIYYRDTFAEAKEFARSYGEPVRYL